MKIWDVTFSFVSCLLQWGPTPVFYHPLWTSKKVQSPTTPVRHLLSPNPRLHLFHPGQQTPDILLSGWLREELPDTQHGSLLSPLRLEGDDKWRGAPPLQQWRPDRGFPQHHALHAEETATPQTQVLLTNGQGHSHQRTCRWSVRDVVTVLCCHGNPHSSSVSHKFGLEFRESRYIINNAIYCGYLSWNDFL